MSKRTLVYKEQTMLISRFERTPLPDTEDGQFMTNNCANDMNNAETKVNATLEESIHEHFLIDFDDVIVKKLKRIKQECTF